MGEIKTMAGWDEFAKENEKHNFSDYCHPGDLIDKELYYHYLNILFPLTQRGHYFQVCEPYFICLDPRTGKCRYTYATFSRNQYGYIYVGHCFADEDRDTTLWINHGTVRNFLEATVRFEENEQGGRPPILCSDGVELSVQAGKRFYSFPKEDLNDGAYTHVEVGPLGSFEKSLLPYAKNKKSPKGSVNACVPVKLVDALIQKHGGFFDCRAYDPVGEIEAREEILSWQRP